MSKDKQVMGNLLEKYQTQEIPIDVLGEIYKLQKAFGSKWCAFDACQNVNDPHIWEYSSMWIKDWAICIFSELSEVLNWLPWKHWKSYKNFIIDRSEIRFELIDILHFSVSLNMTVNLYPPRIDTLLDSLIGLVSPNVVSLASLLDKAKIKENNQDIALEFVTPFVVKSIGRMSKELGHLLVAPVNLETPAFRIFYELLVLFNLFKMDETCIWEHYYAKMQENLDRQKRGY